jgi:uncharacterized membrane protein YsdA (DUF1294 family)
MSITSARAIAQPSATLRHKTKQFFFTIVLLLVRGRKPSKLADGDACGCETRVNSADRVSERVLKINTYLGGSGDDIATRIAVDQN